MRRLVHGIPFVLLAILLGCVVIPDKFEANINVTIRHIQELADQHLRFIEGETDVTTPVGPSSANTATRMQRAWAKINPIQTAHAAELSEDSPRIRQILLSMRERYPQVEEIKKSGAVGENNRGFLELVKADAISSAEERNRVQQIVAADNADRKALYQEVARVNRDQNVTVGTVERIYAQRRLERANAGEVFQLPPAGDDFNAFIASPKGRALGTQAQANAWVTIP